VRLALGLAALLLAAGAAAGDAAPGGAGEARVPDLETLAHRLATPSGVVARFPERKHLALLEDPVESHGEMHFVPPDCLSWRVLRPGRSSLTIEGERVRFRDEASAEALDLSANPVARHFVEAFVVLFNGDLEAMRERYALEFDPGGEGADEGWRLVLVPRAARVRSLIESITLEGRGGPIERMELLEADGDRTVTRFADTQIDHRFDAAELRDLFGPQASCGPR